MNPIHSATNLGPSTPVQALPHFNACFLLFGGISLLCMLLLIACGFYLIADELRRWRRGRAARTGQGCAMRCTCNPDGALHHGEGPVEFPELSEDQKRGTIRACLSEVDFRHNEILFKIKGDYRVRGCDYLLVPLPLGLGKRRHR